MTSVSLNSVASIDGDSFGVVELNGEVKYTVTLKDLINTNVFNAVLSYNNTSLEFVSAKSLLTNTIFTTTDAKDGKASIIIGTSDIKNQLGDVAIAEFTFKVKAEAVVGDTSVAIAKIEIATNDGQGNATDKEAIINDDNKEIKTEIYSYEVASDINVDGKVTLADLSIALTKFTTNDIKSDINRDGTVDTADFIIVVGYIA